MSIELLPMRQLAEVKDYGEDDWTGLTDRQARRKRQNRLSKRAQRKRLAASKQQPTDDGLSGILSQNSGSDPTAGDLSSVSATRPSNSFTAKNPPRPIGHFRIWFPLPADHLLTMVQFNVYRATWINLALVTPATLKSDEYLSRINIDPNALPPNMPPSLVPTALQRQIRHPAWIDSAPHPALRDTLITASGSYDEDEMCMDLLCGLFYNHSQPEYNGLMVWADPWNVSGWEMTEGFVRKWGFLLKGCCLEMLDATNYWRRLRHDDPLTVDIGTLNLP